MSESDKSKEGFRDHGFKSARTTSLFRAVNFELFIKPNKYVMAVGLAAVSVSGCYLLYLNLTVDKDKKTYTAINEDGTQSLRVRGSKWD